MNNPYLKRVERRGSMDHGRKSEERVAKSLTARLTSGSGNKAHDKGDMRLSTSVNALEVLRELLIEAKSTNTGSLPLKHEWLAKISDEAKVTGRTPALSVSFVTPEGKGKRHGDWMVIPMDVFREMVDVFSAKDS